MKAPQIPKRSEPTDAAPAADVPQSAPKPKPFNLKEFSEQVAKAAVDALNDPKNPK